MRYSRLIVPMVVLGFGCAGTGRAQVAGTYYGHDGEGQVASLRVDVDSRTNSLAIVQFALPFSGQCGHSGEIAQGTINLGNVVDISNKVASYSYYDAGYVAYEVTFSATDKAAVVKETVVTSALDTSSTPPQRALLCTAKKSFRLKLQ